MAVLCADLAGSLQESVCSLSARGSNERHNDRRLACNVSLAFSTSVFKREQSSMTCVKVRRQSMAWAGWALVVHFDQTGDAN